MNGIRAIHTALLSLVLPPQSLGYGCKFLQTGMDMSQGDAGIGGKLSGASEAGR